MRGKWKMTKQDTHKHQNQDSTSDSVEHEGDEMHKEHKGMKQGDHESHGGHEDHEGGDHHAHMVADFRRRFWICLILSVPIISLSPMIQAWLGLEKTISFTGDRFVQFAFASAVFLYGGWPFVKGLFDELKEKNPGMMTLIGVAIIVAYTYSTAVVFGLSGKVFFWEIATLIVIMLLGHWIEMRSVMGASGALEELVKLIPSRAHRVTQNGGTEEVATADLKPEDRVAVKPGEKIPTDGVIVEGRTRIDESMITGESRHVEKGEGDGVIGGSINGESAIEMEVKKTGGETYLSQVVDMVKKAQASRSKAQSTADRAAFWLTIVALTAGTITLFSWLASGREFVFSLERMVTVMVITCPHALGLAVPLVVAISTSLAARNGLLIRDRTAFEKARQLNAVVFDKTGTLTEGRFGVSKIVRLGERTEEEILGLAAGLESRSEHTIARGIVEAAKKRNIEFSEPSDFKAIPGKGAEAVVDGQQVKVVSFGYLRENGIHTENKTVESLAKDGNTIVYLLADDRPEGALALTDIIRESSKKAVSRLKGMGLRIMMLTGDSKTVAKAVSENLSLDEFFAEVLPDEKSKKISEIKKRGLKVAMVGDGVNDAPALAESDVGMAIGAGTDVAMESADIVLVRSDPNDVAAVIELSGSTYTKMVQNLWWAAGYNALAIPLAAGVLYPFYHFLLPPAAGAVVMSLSTVIVAFNAQLLRRSEERI
jgi:Cu2+-exporting ATPase